MPNSLMFAELLAKDCSFGFDSKASLIAAFDQGDFADSSVSRARNSGRLEGDPKGP